MKHTRIIEQLDSLREYCISMSDKEEASDEWEYDCMALEAAISAMQALEKYRELEEKLKSLYGDCEGLLDLTVKSLIQRNVTPENTVKTRLLTDESVAMWEQYKSIGTPQECREAMERQQALPPRKALLFEGKQKEIADHNGIKNFDTYRCPKCGQLVTEKSFYPDGFIKHKYCRNCGQHIDWGDEYD